MYQPNNTQRPTTPTRTNDSNGLTRTFDPPKQFIPEQKYGCIERGLWKNKNSVFRIIPGVSPEGEILHQINNPMELWDKQNPGKHLSDTFFSCRIIERFGNQAVISQFAPDSSESDHYPPLETFQKIIHNSVDATKKGIRKVPHPMWSKWVDYRDGELSWSSVAVMMQALMWVINDTQVSGDANPPFAIYGLVYLTHGPSIPGFLEALTQPMDQRKPLSAVDNSNLGPVAEQNGCWLYMNSSSFITDKGEQRTILVPSYVPNGVDPRQMAPNMYPLPDELVKGLWKPWNQLLKFHTMEEQFRLIAQTFGPDTVNYVFQGLDVEPFIPMDIQQCGLGRYENLAQPQQRQRAKALAVAPGSVAPGMMTPQAAPAMTPPVMGTPAMSTPAPTPMPQVSAAPMPQVPTTHPVQQGTPATVPPTMVQQVNAAKEAALRAGVQVMQGAPNIPNIPGTTPGLPVQNVTGMSPYPSMTPEGVSDADLDSLINNAK